MSSPSTSQDGASGSDGGATGGDASDSIAQVCAVTGVSKNVAKNLLEAFDNNVEAAISFHMDNEETAATSSTFTSGPSTSRRTRNRKRVTSSTSKDSADEEEEAPEVSSNPPGGSPEVRAPIPQRREVLVETPDYFENYAMAARQSRRRIRPNVHSVFDGFRDFQAEARIQTEMMERGESSSGNGTGSSIANYRRKINTLEDLFRPPIDLMFRGTFQQARDAGASAKKWLLVNVQKPQEFSCQCLNRDVWSNEMVHDIVKEHFIFWQVYYNTPDGMRYTTFYPIQDWPYVAILDPRTGECMVSFAKLDAQSFTETVSEFLVKHQSPGGTSPPVKKLKSSEPNIIDFSEEDQLKAAIQASLSESAENESDDMTDEDDEELETFESESDGMPTPKKPLMRHRSAPSSGQPSPPSKSQQTSDEDPSSSHKNKNGQPLKRSLDFESRCSTNAAKANGATPAKPDPSSWKKYMGSTDDPQSRILLRLPDGTKEQLALPSSSKVQALIEFVCSLGFIASEYELLTHYPRRSLNPFPPPSEGAKDPLQTTLKEIGLVKPTFAEVCGFDFFFPQDAVCPVSHQQAFVTPESPPSTVPVADPFLTTSSGDGLNLSLSTPSCNSSSRGDQGHFSLLTSPAPWWEALELLGDYLRDSLGFSSFQAAIFRKAGPGYSLTGSTKAPAPSVASRGGGAGSSVPPRETPSQAQVAAANAALQRLELQANKTQQQNRSLALIRARARKELEDEQRSAMMEGLKQQEESEGRKVVEDPALLTVSGVFFHCPLIGPEVLPREEMRKRISSFLQEQTDHSEGEEKALAACLMIRTLNPHGEKTQLCLDTLCKYLDNIINNPQEEKYRKIRVGNKAFQERVMALRGAKEFLLGAGFRIQQLPSPSSEAGAEAMEDFYVFPQTQTIDVLQALRDGLVQAEPITPVLDRGLRVLRPAEVSEQIHLPRAFFNLTAEELQREQSAKAEAVEKLATLRTRVMRERDEKRNMKQYRYSLIRVRFPDTLILQGTFGIAESFREVVNYVRENLEQADSLAFHFMVGTTQRLSSTEESSLAELGLAPAVLLNFIPENEAAAQKKNFLRPDIVELAQSL
ncbi:unnamed protein product [Cyprideis torosa]|uniref:Uncharacterized protein n=1 Tax=Cyprideis torosa TaxID=163714 RepID=A0A7R8ZN18_9CRUS|nr:unnamed protein product [Cyprideis torosa]CAG0890408.1 unnamed protein product [Cyprideis torosa]